MSSARNQNLRLAVETLEDRFAALKRAAKRQEARVLRKIAAVEALDTEDAIRISKHLSRTIQAMSEVPDSPAESTSNPPTLDQVESMVDGIYGHQSKNDTYYFDRRTQRARLQVASSGKQELARVAKVITAIQSLASSGGSFEDLQYVMDEADSIYGDQSLNSTFYPNRAAQETNEDFIDPEDAYDAVVQTRRSPTPSEVDTFGYGGDSLMEQPSTIENIDDLRG